MLGESPRRGDSRSVPRPARGDPLSPREQLEQSADSRRVRGRDPGARAAGPCVCRRFGCGVGGGYPEPSPQSQSFSRSYGSVLPTSLAYIVPLARGCSPWRPDAVMSTTGRERYSVLRIFMGRRGRTGHRATCGALPATGPYLRLNRFQGWQAVKQKR